MKKFNYALAIPVLIFLFLFSPLTVKSNWLKSESKTTPNTPYTQHSKSESLPEGVTQDWLNSLTDESGKRIVFETSQETSRDIPEDPEVDAMQRKIFNGQGAGDQFGVSVSSAGDVNGDGYSDVIIGAKGYSSNTGRAYIFFGGLNMNTVANIIMTGEAAGDLFGVSVSSAGDVNSDGYSDVIVGSQGSNSSTGKACLFFGGISMDSIADVTMISGATNNFLGCSVSTAGDINDDGFDDVIVGSFGYYNGGNLGQARIYLGGISMDSVFDLSVQGGVTGFFFGFSVSTAGDVNGDGYDDVIIGRYGVNSNTGTALIFFGGAPMNNAPDIFLPGESTNNYAGYSVSEAGDVNGDGFSDVIVGAYGYGSDQGRAYIYFGGASMNNISDVTITGEAAGDRFGNSVSGAGDVNGDGYSDVIVGASGYSANTGRTYVYYGGASMNNTADMTMTGETPGDKFGSSVSSAGDVNGDGYSDVIAGAEGYSSNTGRAYIYFGSAAAPVIVDINMFIEGFYNEGSNSQVGDTITVQLRNSISPFALAYQTTAVLETDGTAELLLVNAPNGNYYIKVTQRNSIETWSSSGISVTSGGYVSYDFTNAASQSYGSNMTQIDTSPLRYGIYSGDQNQDGAVDLDDIVNVNNNATDFVNGYVSSDMNGDDLTDLADVVITYNNSVLFVGKITP